MFQEMETPELISQNIICSYCDELITAPPIYLDPIEGYVCGRHPEYMENGRFRTIGVDDSDDSDSQDDLILDSIKCPICLQYMVPPIHQCVLGHSFCSRCRLRLTNCPTCRNSIGVTRNFTLERVTETIFFDCIYKSRGCTFRANGLSMQTHQATCPFKALSCVLGEITNCDYLGTYADIFNHCEESHPAYVQSGTQFQMVYVPYVDNHEVFLVRFHMGLLFRLKYAYNATMLSCTVQVCNTTRPDAFYMYEMEVEDFNNTGFELKSKKLCAKLTDNKEDMKFCTIWHMDMVKPFLSSNSQIKFKCTISEKKKR